MLPGWSKLKDLSTGSLSNSAKHVSTGAGKAAP
jgi:hypothetical protein